MNYLLYILRSLKYYRKQHLALFLGAVLSVMVLTGALLIGSSISFSLNRMVGQRLGNTRLVVTGGTRFLSGNLGDRLRHMLDTPVASLLMNRGSIRNPELNTGINQVAILGIDSSFLPFCPSPIPLPGPGEVVVGEELALRLQIKPGEELILKPEPVSLIPVNAPMARESGPGKSLRLKVVALAAGDQLGYFNLSNNQATALNVFVNRAFLNKRLDLTDKSNVFLVANPRFKLSPDSLQHLVNKVWNPGDMGIKIVQRPEKDGYDLLSDRIFLDSTLVGLIDREKIPCQRIISYLVNDIGIHQYHTPYSFAVAIDSSEKNMTPREGEIMLNNWTAKDLKAKIGDQVVLKYYKIGPFRELREDSTFFQLVRIVPDQNPFIDSTLMPRFPGLTGTGNCRDWDAGVPIQMKRIRDKDEEYWDTYRGTPKVIISASAACRIWKNPFGSVTALRFKHQDINADQLKMLIANNIHPGDLGIQFADVREEGQRAASQAVDFAGLFMGMSFFTILAAILLTTLLLSLNNLHRVTEEGILAVLGFSSAVISRLRFIENMLVLFLGSITGAILGIAYNALLIYGLKTLWNDMVRTQLLQPHISIPNLLSGMSMGFLFMILPVYFQTRKRMKHTLVYQLKSFIPHPPRKVIRYLGVGLMILALMLCLLTWWFNWLNEAELYMTASFLFLTGSLLVIFYFLKKGISFKEDRFPIIRLAFRNLQMNAGRSIAVVALLALGIFTILLTGAYRRTYYGEENNRQSGTGGFLLWGENTSGISFNLNTEEGRSRLMLQKQDDVDSINFLQLMSLEGDDASCLNLNQAQHPGLLGVYPQVFDSLQAFRFISLLPDIPADHPWMALNRKASDHVFYVFADQNVIQFSLHKQIGDTLFYMNEAGVRIGLKLAGALDNSVFQGRILMASGYFREQFPSRGASRVLLVDGPTGMEKRMAQILTSSLQDYGMNVTSTRDRLATFNSVENTYLTVFMMLSGLGFLIGTVGLGIILMRNIQERKKELALMTALGISGKNIFWVVFTEHLLLFMGGVVAGILSAFTGILPTLMSPAFHILSVYMAFMILLIMLSGFLWIGIPAWIMIHKPCQPSLWEE